MLYQIIQLDDPENENGIGKFTGMVSVDSNMDVIGQFGTGEGIDYKGVLHHWAPEPGFIAVKHPEGRNQPMIGEAYPDCVRE